MSVPRIEPTVGRVIWYFNEFGQGPMAALVTDAHAYLAEGHISVVYFPPGAPSTTAYVPLVQAGEARPEKQAWVEWMPYQQATAATTSTGGTAATAPHVQRMKEELDQLMDRVTKLGKAIVNDELISGLSELEVGLMNNQYHAMQRYLEALSSRYALASR